METNHPRKQPVHILRWALVSAIVIVMNLFFNYAIELVYPEPKFDTFCPVRQEQYTSPETCVGAGGQWSNYQLSPKEITTAVQQGQQTGWCDVNFTCNQDYTEARSVYNRNIFIILIVLSLVSLAVGIFIPIEVLSLGFSWAGVVSLIIASLRYWSDADNWMRVLILALALALLIWIAVKKFKNEE